MGMGLSIYRLTQFRVTVSYTLLGLEPEGNTGMYIETITIFPEGSTIILYTMKGIVVTHA